MTSSESGAVETETPAAAAEDLTGALEAVLLVVDEPADEAVLAAVVEHPVESVRAALEQLKASYDGRNAGMELRRVAAGWRLFTRTDFAPWVERYVRDGQQSRLTQAALETLAVVAYRQPVTRSRVAAVRGVNVDAVMRTLLARGLVAEAGTEPTSQATLYVTTPYFLDRLGIGSLEELPPLGDYLPDYASLDDDLAMPS